MAGWMWLRLLLVLLLLLLLYHFLLKIHCIHHVNIDSIMPVTKKVA
jgi:hypothetical protein